MGYLNESGLARYDSLIKSWTTYDSGTVTGLAPLLNWQKTADAASVTCYPVPVSPLEPVVSFMFTETPPLDGNPKSPTNPSTITGVSSITVTRCESAGVDETDYAIDLGGTYYGGTLDVANGTLTVTVGQYVFNGTENITSWTVLDNVGRAAFPLNNITALSGGEQACTHLPYVYGWSADYTHFYVNTSEGQTGAIIFAPYFTQDAMKAWMASQYTNGTPVTIVWTLRQPFTVQLSPVQIYSLSQGNEYTPRLNTVYSDQQSVQVGYAKSPIQTESELTNAIISLGGNI